MNVQRCRGFSLFDLLIILAIIGILASLILPVLSRARESARRTQCASNLRQIMTACYMYADSPDSGGTLPTTGKDIHDAKAKGTESLHLLYRQYINDPRIYACPSDPTRPSPLRLQQIQPWQPKGGKPAQPMQAADTSYQFDPGHSTEISALTAFIADRSTDKQNSKNHGRALGQNVGFGTSVEFRTSVRNPLGNGAFDNNIYALNQLAAPKGRNLTRDDDSFIRD